jgi:hypothetical protein
VDEAAARLLAFAPPVSIYSCVSACKPAWTLHLGPLTLKNCVYIGNTVYVDHSRYYASGMVSDVFLERWACDPVGFQQCLVEGAWMDDQADGGDGGEFYLLIHKDWCLRKAWPLYPMRWIISNLDHTSIDPDFQDGAFPCLRSAQHHNLIIAQNGCPPTSESGCLRHYQTADEATIGICCIAVLFERILPIQLFARRRRDRPKMPDYFGIYAALFGSFTLSIDGKSLLCWLITFCVCHKSY